MTTPKLSIIIPAHNAAAFIGEAVRSALGQTGPPCEVIVVDDGSTDATPEALQLFARHPDVTLLRQSNQGSAAARNAGLGRARGAYVGFLDADDRWLPGKAARHAALLDANPEFDLTYSWWRVVDEAGRLLGRSRTTPPARQDFEGLLIENFTGTASTVVARRTSIEQLGGFAHDVHYSEDLELWLRVALLRDRNIACVPHILTEYRSRRGQITSDWRRIAQGWRSAVERALQHAPERVASVMREAEAGHWRYLAFIAHQSGDYPNARRLLRRAWASSPALLARDRRALLTTGAVLAATLLPARTYEALRHRAISWRADRAERMLTSAGRT